MSHGEQRFEPKPGTSRNSWAVLIIFFLAGVFLARGMTIPPWRSIICGSLVSLVALYTVPATLAAGATFVFTPDGIRREHRGGTVSLAW
ncbi:MAG TPA: hypothetical protein DCR55_17105 [Lentisphaeria bacterium]|nr:hypothetical protein [Lentisphaeria bacterium]